MYHEKVIADRIARIEASPFGAGRKLREYPIEEVESWIAHLDSLWDKDKESPTRAFTPEESDFVTNELLMTKASYRYWASRYAIIGKEAAGVGRMHPLLESQEFVLSRIADIELETHENRWPHGIRVNVLKAARQVGVSTLSETIAAHRITTQNNVQGIIASDVPKNSGYLFSMMERVIDNLPWWMKPVITDRVKNTEIKTDGGSHIWVEAGKSVRGTTGQRGQLGRGMSLSIVHLSELSTWEATDQISEALLPTLPHAPRTLAIFESTAKGRGDFWHEHWKACRTGRGFEFRPIFVPWYVEKKYSWAAPVDWIPADTTLAHARRCSETSAQWIGKSITPTREQLYWYEQMRASYEAAGNLKGFLEEYGALDDEECFQHSGHSVFSIDVQQAVRDIAQQPLALLDIKPYREIMAERQ